MTDQRKPGPGGSEDISTAPTPTSWTSEITSATTTSRRGFHD